MQLKNYNKMKPLTIQPMKQKSAGMFEVQYVVLTNSIFFCHTDLALVTMINLLYLFKHFCIFFQVYT